MFREKDSVTLTEQPHKTFYYPHDPKKTGDVSDFPPKYITKETRRLTKLDIQKNGFLRPSEKND
jgi:hypothetical protein